MQEALKNGTSVGVFPEGSRNRSSSPLKPFHDGAFLLSHKSGYPIAVLTIVGSGKCLPDDAKLQLNPGVIHCYWETILESDKQVEDLKAKSWNAIWERLNAEGY
jgi:1-acyl-sn-glycerol-3-phosphate acyltransferase